MFNKHQIACYNYEKNCTKIANYPEEIGAKEHIGEQIKLVYQLIGLRPDNWPGKAANMAIADFVYVNYKHFAPQEIKFAFDMAFQSRLSGVKLEHYQSFSIPYLASVLQAYDSYKKVSMIKIDEYQGIKDQIIEKASRYRLSDKAIKDIIFQSYQQVLAEEEVGYTFSMEKHYEILSYCGLIDFNTQDKLEILARAEQEVKDQISIYETQIANQRRNKKDVQSIAFVCSKIKENFENTAYDIAKTITLKMQLKRFAANKFKMEDLMDRVNNTICWLDPLITKEMIELKQRIKNG